MAALPLRPGDRGLAVSDLQARLGAIGERLDEPTGCYDRSTEAAVRSFQAKRGLPADGVCDAGTWEALVEAGYRLGDRLLFRASPMLRGDDVAELQRLLSGFGFDAGRIDGIFGDLTAAALLEFQRNLGLTPDGSCGHRTITELRGLVLHQRTSELVSRVREELRLGRALGLPGRRVGVAQAGGFTTGMAALSRALAGAGALPVPLANPDPSRQAAEANAADLDCVVSLGLEPERLDCSTAYFGRLGYESPTSRRLAELIQAELPSALALDDGGARAMALPILRETRMPAVDVRLGAPAIVVQRTADVAQVLVRALAAWVATAWRSPASAPSEAASAKLG